MQAFRVSLRPSRRLIAATSILSLCTVCTIIFYFQTVETIIGLIALCGCIGWAWRVQSLRSRSAIRIINIDTRGRASLILANGETCSATLLSDSLVHRFGCIPLWQTPNGIIRHTVLPDMTNSDSYRRFTVWLRFSGMMVARMDTEAQTLPEK